jgi:flagellar motility protein MotE (MotC chaperone)
MDPRDLIVVDRERYRIRSVRFRVLPVMLLAAFLMLTVKLGDVWEGFSDISSTIKVTSNSAQAETPVLLAEAGKKGDVTANLADATRDQMVNRDPTRFSQSEIDLLQKLADRRDQLEKRERSLEQRDAMLAAAEKRLQDKTEELQAMKTELQAMLSKHNEQEDNRLKSLVRIYETMKPKEAAQIFDKLEMPVLIGVVERMKEAKVAPILANMQPERAKAVTAMLADRPDVISPQARR